MPTSLVTPNGAPCAVRIFFTMESPSPVPVTAAVLTMVLPAAVIAVGMFEGASWGAIFGLALGIFADMDYVENTVMFTLLLPALAFFAGFVSQFFINRRFFAYMGAAFAACLITAVVQMVGTAASDGWSTSMLVTVALQTLWSLPPAVLVYFPPAKWIE